MSQFPSPYPGPIPCGYSWPNPHDTLLAPARRAGLLLTIIGVLGLLCGSCVLALIPLQSMIPPEQMSELNEAMAQSGMSIHAALGITAVLMGLPGVLLVIMGLLTRKGNAVAIYISIVVVGLMLLALMVGILATLATASRQQVPGMALNLCVWVVMAGLLVLALVWLIQAAKNSGQLQWQYQQQLAQQQQYAAQYWQYAQQQYGQQQPQMQQQPPAGQMPAPPQQPPDEPV